jgi:hypothetical protein
VTASPASGRSGRPDPYSTAGVVMLPLLLAPRSWIHRRVETIRFVDERTVRRSVSVDFSLPVRRLLPFEFSPHIEMTRQGPETSTSGSVVRQSLPQERAHPVYVVPIATLKKSVLTAFDLRNEAGDVLPLLTRTENSRIAGAALMELAETYLNNYGRSVGDMLKADLRGVAGGDIDDARAALERVLHSVEPDKEARELLARSDRFNYWMRLLAESFLVLARLDDRMSRRVIKFSYEEPFPRAKELMRTPFASLGWRPAVLPWDAPGAAYGPSYHFEVELPSDLEVLSCEMHTGDGRGTSQLIVGAPERRAHVHVANLARDATAQVRVSTRARRRGILRAAPAVATLNALMLTGGGFRLTELLADTGGAATLLVLAPALLAAYVARPGEHGLVTELLLGVRRVLFISGALAIAAAALLVVKVDGNSLVAVWWSLTGGAWAVAVVLAVSFVLPRPGRGRN